MATFHSLFVNYESLTTEWQHYKTFKEKGNITDWARLVHNHNICRKYLSIPNAFSKIGPLLHPIMTNFAFTFTPSTIRKLTYAITLEICLLCARTTCFWCWGLNEWNWFITWCLPQEEKLSHQGLREPASDCGKFFAFG